MARGTLKNLKRSRPVGGKPTTTTGLVVEPDHHLPPPTTTTTSISSSTAVNQQQQHFPSSSPRGAPSSFSSSSSSTMPLDQHQHHHRQHQHAPPPPSSHHHQQHQRQEKEDLSFIRGGGNWLNCEGFFSLLLVGLLAALPFNLHFSEIFQPRGNSLIRAKELSRSGAYDKAIPLYEKALKRQATLEGHTAFAEALIHLHRSTEASRHLQQAEQLLSSLRGGQHQKEQVEVMDEMGRLYYQLGRFDLAGPHFQNILSIEGGTNCPEVAEAHLQLGKVKIEEMKYDDAIWHMETASSMSQAKPSTVAQSYLLLANLFQEMGELDKALIRFRKAHKASLRDGSALALVAIMNQARGQFDKAVTWYGRGMSSMMDLEEYMMQAITGITTSSSSTSTTTSPSLRPSSTSSSSNNKKTRTTTTSSLPPSSPPSSYDTHTPSTSSPPPPLRAPPVFLSLLFDLEANRKIHISRSVHHQLSQHHPNQSISTTLLKWASILHYHHYRQEPPLVTRAHEAFGLVFKNTSTTMRNMVDTSLGVPRMEESRWLDVLDLGCGTGEAGLSFRSLANTLVGIDLSPASIHFLQTYVPQLYDQLYHADIMQATTYLAILSQDLIIMCGSMPYFGPLKEVLKMTYQLLRPGGMLVFNTDLPLDDCEGGGARYFLEFTGRWSHCSTYVQDLAKELKYDILQTNTLTGLQHFQRSTTPPSSSSGSLIYPEKLARPLVRKTMNWLLKKRQ